MWFFFFSLNLIKLKKKAGQVPAFFMSTLCRVDGAQHPGAFGPGDRWQVARQMAHGLSCQPSKCRRLNLHGWQAMIFSGLDFHLGQQRLQPLHQQDIESTAAANQQLSRFRCMAHDLMGTAVCGECSEGGLNISWGQWRGLIQMRDQPVCMKQITPSAFGWRQVEKWFLQQGL
jgi:hypothetical protein